MCFHHSFRVTYFTVFFCSLIPARTDGISKCMNATDTGTDFRLFLSLILTFQRFFYHILELSIISKIPYHLLRKSAYRLKMLESKNFN